MILRTSLAVAVAIISCLEAQGRRSSMPKLENLVFEQSTFESKALRRKASYGVFLPKDYKSQAQKQYPLVIWLHGMFEDHMRFATRGGAPILDRMTGKGQVPRMIFVTANGGRSSFYVNGKDSGKNEDLIIVDLLAHLEETYRIAKDPGMRAIMGVSMGGFGALNIALRHPKLFRVVASHSAAIFPPDPDNLSERHQRALEGWGKRLGLDRIYGKPLEKKRWQANNPLHIIASSHRRDLAGLKIYFDCGSADRYEFDSGNESLHKLMEQRDIDHSWQLVDGGGHGWASGYNTARLPHSLAFVAKEFTLAKGKSGLESLLPAGESDRGKGEKRR